MAVEMGRYKILLRGDNLLLNFDGDHEKFGFYATRVVKSESVEDAELKAIIRIHHELNKNKQIVKNTLDAPSVTVEKIEKLRFYQFVWKRRARGLTFHKEDEIDKYIPC